MRIIDQESLCRQVKKMMNGLDREHVRDLLGLKRLKDREMALPVSRWVELAVVFRLSHIGCLKAFWLVLSQESERRGEGFPCYQIFQKWFARFDRLLCKLLDMSLCRLGNRLGFVDGMKLPICDPARFVKAMGRQAGRGHSGTGDYYGRKLHALVSTGGLLHAYDLTPASVHDLAPVKAGMLAGHTGVVYADKGYISLSEHKRLRNLGLDLWAKPRANMGFDDDGVYGYVREFELRHAGKYRRRQNVERYFARLKREFGLSIRGLRSRRTADAYCAAAMLAAQWILTGAVVVAKVV